MEAPLEYDLIVNAVGSGKAPSADMIEAVGYASINPLFKKRKFRLALIEYRKNGLYGCRPRKPITPELELRYMKLRSGSTIKAGTTKMWDKT